MHYYEFMEKIRLRNNIRKITPAQLIIFGFIGLILSGTLLLMLPISNRHHVMTPFLDALFTATSASCVTGLVVHDTAQYWSLFGQIVILCLIQIGGLGVITMAILLSIFRKKKIGFRQRFIMQQSISAPRLEGIIRNTKWILKAVLLIETIGMLLLSIRFIPQFGIVKGLWFSIFHSISAFCNAGFDLMGQKQSYSSLTNYIDDSFISNVICLLIIIGGLGFFVWIDILTNKFKFHRYSLHSKIVLTTTTILLIGGSAFFFFNDFSHWHMNASTQINASIFQAVSPRTAGFNTVDLTKLTESSILFMTLLMLIGGSPGSTAGGFKTTTLAVLVLSIRAVFNHKQNPQCFARRIPTDTLNSAAALFTLYMILLFTGTFLIASIDKLPILTTMFEVASAVGTVGSTLGVTPSLSAISHCILIFLMFFGRVGGLTLLLAISKRQVASNANLPQENVTIG